MKLINQLDARDCGPSCLAMIAKYYNNGINIRTIRDCFDTNTDGVSILSISRIAERIGFKTIGGMITFSSFSSQQILPCIAHWDQNHFVVVYIEKGDIPSI